MKLLRIHKRNIYNKNAHYKPWWSCNAHRKKKQLPTKRIQGTQDITLNITHNNGHCVLMKLHTQCS
jgi:hypothetical protein